MTSHGGVHNHRLLAWLRCSGCGLTTTGGPMDLDPEFSELLGFCLDREVRFLVVGGYAVAAHGHPRFTMDLDIWLMLDGSNADRLLQALDDFGFGSLGLTVDDFAEPDQVIQLGYPPKRVDLLTGIDGVDFDACWDRRSMIDIAGRAVPFISESDLKVNKRASGRLQDLADVEALEPNGSD